jgi:hypothetical protein
MTYTTGVPLGMPFYLAFGISSVHGGSSPVPASYLGDTSGVVGIVGANAQYADGSVHFLTNAVSPATLAALTTRNYGDIVGADGY